MEVDTIFGNSQSFNPAHPIEMYYIVREQTFEHWPRQIAQEPKDLIKNGFFYTGHGDRVTCFYCNLTLKQWETDDCIEVEHMKWEPNCMFAKMISSSYVFDVFQCC